MASTYGVHLLLPDLTPNVGLWWSFFIEMFVSFREFFLCFSAAFGGLYWRTVPTVTVSFFFFPSFLGAGWDRRGPWFCATRVGDDTTAVCHCDVGGHYFS